MDIALLFLLILLNGVFAMSEMAVVSARKARLHSMADDGSPGAAAALALNNEPSGFLSTVQVGITIVAILSGLIGETVLADPLTLWLSAFPGMEPYARGISLTLVVLGLTYLSVVIGELVPKRMALMAPETVAALIARPMMWLARAARPLVWLLSSSSDLLLRLIGARPKDEPPVTNEEINVLMGQGAEAGVFHESEQEIVSNVLRLDEQRVGAIMTPRKDLYTLDLDATDDELRQQIADSPHSRIIVCRDGLDHIVGVLQTGNLLKRSLSGELLRRQDVEAAVTPPLYLPETMTITQLLANFRRARLKFALIVDEYGDLQGLVTLTDVLTFIVGEVSLSETVEQHDMVQRDDGSWLMDGDVTVERIKTVLEVDEELPGQEDNAFHTLGGFMMHMLRRVPVPGDHFEYANFRFEVMDMDKNRVDKVLIARTLPEATDPANLTH